MRVAKLAVGTISVLAVLALAAVPAPAGTAAVEIIDGQFDVRDWLSPTDPPLLSFPAAACGSSGMASASGSGSGTFSVSIDGSTRITGLDRVMTFAASFDGTYSGSTITITDGTLTAWVRDEAAACSPTGSVLCTIDASDFTGSGWAQTLPVIPITFWLDVANAELNTTATGAGCGAVGALMTDNILELEAEFAVF